MSWSDQEEFGVEVPLELPDLHDEVAEDMLLTGRCRDCATGFHERCEGFGISRCRCYCADLLLDEEEHGPECDCPNCRPGY